MIFFVKIALKKNGGREEGRMEGEKEGVQSARLAPPLNDIPFVFEVYKFLRKMLMGCSNKLFHISTPIPTNRCHFPDSSIPRALLSRHVVLA